MRNTWLKKTITCILATVLATSILSSPLPMRVIANEHDEKQRGALITITSEDQLTPYFPDANLRKAVFHAVSDGQDEAEGTNLVDALANFTGDVVAKKKGITDAHGIELLRKAGSIDLTHNEIKDLSFLGRDESMGEDYERWYGFTQEDGEQYDRTNVFWDIGGNPLEKLPLNFGGRLVIEQAGSTSYSYPDDVSKLTTFLRSDFTNGSISEKININRSKIDNNGTWENVDIKEVHPLNQSPYTPLHVSSFDNEYAYFTDLSKSSSISKIGIGTDQVLHYRTSDEFGTITPGSQSFKYYITERFQIYDKITVHDEYDGIVQLRKTNETNKPLSGARFELYHADGTLYNSHAYVSDTSGNIEVEGLAPGNYYFLEIEAPEGYLKSNEPFTFTIENSTKKTTILDGGFTEITPTGATSPVVASDNERFMVGPNGMDAASPDITLTKPKDVVVNKVYLDYTYADATNGKIVVTDEEYTTLEAAAVKINELKNNNQLLGDIRVTVQHNSTINTNKTIVTAKNEKIPLRDINVIKEWKDHEGWQGTHPDITIRLYQDGTEIDNVILSAGNTQHTFSDLPTKDNQGKNIVYSVSEDPVASQEGIYGYTATIRETSDGFKITNEWTIDDEFHIKDIKTWQDYNNAFGERPASFDIILKQDGKEFARKTVSKDNKWMFAFNNIPLYSSVDKPYTYTIEEDFNNKNYTRLDLIPVNTSGLEHLSEVEILITNTLKEIVNKVVTFSGTKTWNDYNNAFHLRPTSIEVELLRDNKVIDTQEVTANKQQDWTYSFTNLEKYDNDGKEYVYAINEKEIAENYTAVVDGNNLINTLDPTKNETSIEVIKTWIDFNNALETRPASIEIKLLQDGNEFKTATLTADLDTPWKAVFEELPK